MQDVLLVTIDSLRADHVGYHGYHRNTTPAIDRYAGEGTQFTQAFAHACSTRRSFPSILSSVYPTMYGGFERVGDHQVIIAEVFDDAGYRTGGFHSNPYLGSEFGYSRGFDTFSDPKSDSGTTTLLRQTIKNKLDNDGVIYGAIEWLYQGIERTTGTNVGSPHTFADSLTDNAIKWLEQANSDNNPIFLWVHYMDVHHPYNPPAEHQREFRKTPISDSRAIKLRRKMLESPESVTGTELANIIDLYDAEIRYVDAQVDRLINAARDHLNDPIVAITSDHGDEFLDHGGFSHSSTFYEEIVHVPLLFVDGAKSRTENGLAGLVNLSPTLLELAGVDVPDAHHGRSLVPVMEEAETGREAIVGCSPHCFYRDKRWKYIARGPQLYDLEADPEEKSNVADDHSDILTRIREFLEDHQRVVEKTAEDIENVEIDKATKERLRDLGYRE